MRRLIIALIILFAVVLPTHTFAQGDLSDISETFKVFQKARSLTTSFDLTASEYVPALPDDYRLGPGDVIQIMAGSLIMDVELMPISPQGQILIPPAAPIYLEGLTVDEAKQLIRDTLSIYYKNLTVELQLVQARKIKVYLTGQVMQPGIYVTFAGASPIEFLQAASELVDVAAAVSDLDETPLLSPYFRIMNASASRMIKVLRDGEELVEIDVAAVLQGAQEPDIYLQGGDVVYVPEIKRPVIVRGGVIKPGKYEINRDEDLTDILLMAGGTTSEQFLTDLTVERKTDFGYQLITVTVNRDYVPIDSDFELRPGDIVRVPEVANYVYVLGGVWLPAAVEYREGWGVVDYLAQTGGPTAPADWSAMVLIKNPGTPDTYKVDFDFKEITLGNPTNYPEVEPGDVIWVPYKNKAWSGPGVTGTILQFASFARFLWD